MVNRHFNTSIMFVDMKGFTSRTASSSRKELQKTLDEYENLVFPVFNKFGGKVIKGLGDAYLVSFSSPTNSVLCGLEIQNQIKERNKLVSRKDGFEARVGLSSGEVYERGGDIFGDSVNLASRVQGVAKGGQVAFSESVYHAMNKNEISFSSLGKHKLKGFDGKAQIYLAHDKQKLPRITRVRIFIRRNRKGFLITLLFLLFFVIATRGGVRELGDEWISESESALSRDNGRDMKQLLGVYESEPDFKKGIKERLLAAKMYASIGRGDMALNEFREALSMADSDQVRQIYDAAREKGIQLPSEGFGD